MHQQYRDFKDTSKISITLYKKCPAFGLKMLKMGLKYKERKKGKGYDVILKKAVSSKSILIWSGLQQLNWFSHQAFSGEDGD